MKNSILDEYKASIGELFSKTKKLTEFEFDLNMDKQDINYERYIEIMRYLTFLHSSKKLNILRTTSLDINYNEINDDVRDNYRITVSGTELINKYISILQNRRNHVVYNVMMNVIRDKKYPDAIKMFHKMKKFESSVDIPELNTRIRSSAEEEMTPKEIGEIKPLDETFARRISFRYKQRISLIIEDTPEHIIRIDLTNVKLAQAINKIDNSYSNYELEIEYFAKAENDANRKNALETMIEKYMSLMKVIQQSNYIITKSHVDNVLGEYKRLLSIPDKTIYSLDGRQPVSLEIQHATELLANKYAVVDKADGDRYFMIICFSHVYLISQTLVVKDTGIVMKNSEYDGTILDCEYVYLPKFKRHIILPFDCLFVKGEDVRKNPMLMERIAIAQKVINECFVFGKQKGFKQKEQSDKNTVDNLMKYYISQLDEYMKSIMYDIEYEKQYPLIRVKFFMPVSGLADNEIFKYSMIIWNKYLYDDIKYPYSLDGLIYQPLNQPYVTNIRESKFSDYKWKPAEKNTIDFFIKFEKDRATGKIVNVFDNSDDKHEANKPYRICYLYNGKRTFDGETPMLFNEEQKLHIAHLFIEDGNVKDVNGDILQDETVVEFYYNSNLEVGERFRWIPLKTRYDKTEMVNRHGIKFGNSVDVAARIWRSITVPVKISDIATLSDDAMYNRHLNNMRSKITRELIISAAKENVYYQIKTNLAEPMRNFHNWVKSVTIFTYCGVDYNNNKPKYVLDVGCGRGGDLMKFYHAKIASGVCIDVDYETLHNAVDGAISRYNGHRKKYPAFPKINIICADFTVPLDAESQLKSVQDKTPANKYMLEKSFPKSDMQQFDVINSQFSFHYFLANEKTWKNACLNINKCLKAGGYLIITTFDAQRVIEVFGDQQKYTTYYTTNGEKKILMDIVKKFPDKTKTGLGLAIDVYNSLISTEGTYNTEYLVDKSFLVDELKDKCGLELVDTCMFDTLFEINRDNITRIANFDENEKTKAFLQTVATFYDQKNELNAECFKISRLNRYYVFRKIDATKF